MALSRQHFTTTAQYGADARAVLPAQAAPGPRPAADRDGGRERTRDESDAGRAARSRLRPADAGRKHLPRTGGGGGAHAIPAWTLEGQPSAPAWWAGGDIMGNPQIARRGVAPLGAALLLVVAVVGIAVVKWYPYVFKAIYAAHAHDLGPSIVSGTAAHAPPFSAGAALGYAITYLKAIWEALVLGILLGAGVQTLVPQDWLLRTLGGGARSSLVAGALAVPSMMCTCCGAPIAVGLRRAGTSPGAVLAYWVGNPVLNPATIVFLGFVLGWGWAALRIVTGVALVAAVAWYGERYIPRTGLRASLPSPPAASPPSGGLVRRWLWAAAGLAIGLVPEYIAIVLILGAVRSFLFPAMSPAIGSGILLFFGLAVAGTLFVIPTAGEVPILQTLFGYGLGSAAGGALMLALPAVSLPSLWMVGKALPWRALVVVAAIVVVAACAAGGLALLFHLR